MRRHSPALDQDSDFSAQPSFDHKSMSLNTDSSQWVRSPVSVLIHVSCCESAAVKMLELICIPFTC